MVVGWIEGVAAAFEELAGFDRLVGLVGRAAQPCLDVEGDALAVGPAVAHEVERPVIVGREGNDEEIGDRQFEPGLPRAIERAAHHGEDFLPPLLAVAGVAGDDHRQQGEIGAAGGWQLAGNQIALQGTYAFALNPFNVLPYSLIMTITNYQPALINFTAMSGELVVWQRLS